MDRLPRILPILFFAALVAFLGALLHLIVLRYESPSAYPPYSSMRSDPLGCRVLCESLQSVAGLRVGRHTDRFTKLADGRDTTLFLIGAPVSRDPLSEVEAVERFVSEGGRLVIAFHATKPPRHAAAPAVKRREPENDNGEKDKASEGDKEAETPDPGDTKHGEEESEEKPGRSPLVSIDDRWGFKSAYEELPKEKREKVGHAMATVVEGRTGLPATLPWYGALYFKDPVEAWRPLYSYEGRTLAMERDWGRGAIVLLSDSYLLSNEAMRKDRHADLLTWLAGTSSSVIFDEAHLGIIERRTILEVAADHGLMAALGVLLVAAALFIWRYSTSLVPRREASLEEETEAAARQRDHHAGLVNLLRRAVPESELISVCLAEWLRSYPQEDPATVSRRDSLLGAFTPGKRTPVNDYRALCEALHQSRHRHGHKAQEENKS